jgi:4'-phosphopantetheinyl transferase
MSGSSPRSTAAPVEVWYDTTAAWLSDPDRADRVLTWLTEPERVRYARFFHDDDRWMFAMGRAMARQLVGRALDCAPADWRWREGPHGRPEIDEPGTTWHFNVAHSAGLVACAIAEACEIGVDVEDLERKPVTSGFASRYLSPAEGADVDAQAPDLRQDRLLTYWTLKEAYLKARGLGVSVTLSDIEFTFGPDGPRIGFLDSLAGTETDWHFHLERPTPRHLMAVASRRRGVSVHDRFWTHFQ